MTRKPHRTLPLDRDGDGRNGGSLPGNKTAPMADTEAETGRQPRSLTALEFLDANGRRPTPEDFDGTDPLAPLLDADVGRHDDLLGREVTQEDVEAQYVRTASEPDTVDELADARTTSGDSPEKLEAIEREVDEANAAARADDAPDPADTFTAEEIAAGQTPMIQAEGDAAVTAAEVATEIPSNDPLVQIETETAPIAVRARELRLLVESRRLYKSAEGYSATYGAPYVDQATVDGWIQAGLAEDVPTAGICGGIKPTHEARRHLGQLTLGHYAPGTIGAAGEDAA